MEGNLWLFPGYFNVAGYCMLNDSTHKANFQLAGIGGLVKGGNIQFMLPLFLISVRNVSIIHEIGILYSLSVGDVVWLSCVLSMI